MIKAVRQYFQIINWSEYFFFKMLLRSSKQEKRACTMLQFTIGKSAQGDDDSITNSFFSTGLTKVRNFFSQNSTLQRALQCTNALQMHFTDN